MDYLKTAGNVAGDFDSLAKKATEPLTLGVVVEEPLGNNQS